MGLGPGVLAGLRVLLTRPASEAEESARAVQAAGGEALVAPGLELSPEDPGPLAAALRDRPDVVALTSVNAARAVLAADPERPEGLAGSLVAVVGERTAAVLREAGARVDLIPRERSAAGLFAALRAARPELRGLRVLVPRAADGREELLALLEGAGADVRAVVAYRMAPAPPERMAAAVAALRAGAVDLAPFGSPRSARPLLDALGPEGPELLRRCAVGAIGATTAAALRASGVAVDAVAEGASFEQLIAQLAGLARARAARR